jgi:hypothetical protein
VGLRRGDGIRSATRSAVESVVLADAAMSPTGGVADSGRQVAASGLPAHVPCDVSGPPRNRGFR